MSVQNIGISGLQAASVDLQVAGNNIANANTFGFKQGHTEFADLFYAGRAGMQVGNGVQVAAINQEFTSVGFTSTGGSYDMSINNDGFFVTRKGAANGQEYTRAGNFKLNNDGFLVNQTGEFVQGYNANNNIITSRLGDIHIPFNQVVPPKMTGNVGINLNLDASVDPITLPFSATDSATYNSRNSVSILDSLGASHILNTYYIKTATNNWDVQVEIDGTSIGSGNLTFDGTGNLLSQTGLNAMTFDPGGGATPGQVLNLSFSDCSQYGSDMLVRGLSADGYATGIPGGISIDNNGIIGIGYSNGEVVTVGQIAIAKFNNPQGLESVGNTAWSETSLSGRPLISQGASTNAFRAGTLENSNVDLTEQLVKLIAAQRSFQANAQSIRAGDMITQTIINIE